MRNEVYRIGNLHTNERPWVYHQQDRVYSIEGVSACISVGGGGVPNILIEKNMKEVEKTVEQVKSMLADKTEEVDVILQDNGTICPRTKDKGLRVQKLIVQNEKNVSETLTTIHEPKIYGETTKYKIRRLTERECFRLMDVPEDSIDKMVSNISGTQCYKLAGNSIVVACLYHIFRKMFVQTSSENKDGQLSLF